MSIFSKFKSAFSTVFTTDKEYITNYITKIIGKNGFDNKKALAISTVYTCIDILSKTLAKLPREVFETDVSGGKLKDKSDYRYELLHDNPNNYTTSFSFFNAIEANRNLRGNGFARIHRNNHGQAYSLEIIKPSRIVDYKIVNGNLYYAFVNDNGDIEAISSNDMLHFKMLTIDGIWGINPIEALRLNLSTTWKGMNTIDNFYDNNAVSPKALKSTVAGANQKAILEALQKFQKEYAGSLNAGQLMPLPPNTEIQELSLNMADAEFISTIKFNANQIAGVFGIPPHMVGNTETSKYNNVEQMTIGFKSDTISPIAKMYKEEFRLKLLTPQEKRQGKDIELNLMAMIETDHKTRMEGYKTLSQIGAISPNKIAQIENLPTDENGDVRLIPMNMMTLDKLKNNSNVKS